MKNISNVLLHSNLNFWPDYVKWIWGYHSAVQTLCQENRVKNTVNATQNSALSCVLKGKSCHWGGSKLGSFPDFVGLPT